MVIDPNPNTRHRLKDTLRGIEIVDSVLDRGSPHLLLDILADNPVHVIIIDEDPGAGDVYDIVRLVISKKVAAHTSFVLMSEHLDEATLEKGREAGVKAFLAKPYDMRSIEKVLQQAGADMLHAHQAPPRQVPDALRDTLDKLRQVQIFSDFTDNELIRLLKICRTRNFPAESYVFREGEPGYSLFVLVAGKLEIRKKIDGVDKVLVKMGSGDCFGEIAIIDDEPRSADAVCATNCTVIEVNEAVVNNNDDMLSLKLVRQLAILLARKLRMQSR